MTDTPEYQSLLRAEKGGSNSFSQASFSLNISLYNKLIIATIERQEMHFFMQSRVHSYALIWKVEPSACRGPVEGSLEYCIPALIVPDLSYQASIYVCSAS
ncbi:hypothetical protein AUP68_02413 [Ilyonectria robusta]